MKINAFDKISCHVKFKKYGKFMSYVKIIFTGAVFVIKNFCAVNTFFSFGKIITLETVSLPGKILNFDQVAIFGKIRRFGNP